MGVSKVSCGTCFVCLGLCESHWHIILLHFNQIKLCCDCDCVLGDTCNTSKLRRFAASYWPLYINLAEFPSRWRGQSCVWVEGVSKGNMSHDHLLSEPNEAPFALSNLPPASAALAANALVSCISPVCLLVWTIVYATRMKPLNEIYAIFKWSIFSSVKLLTLWLVGPCCTEREGSGKYITVCSADRIPTSGNSLN